MTRVLLLFVATGFLHAAEVRGRLEKPQAPNGQQQSAGGIAVTVYSQKAGRSAPSYSGVDGMYHIRNLKAGAYYLEIWTSRDPRVRPTVYPIQVNEPLTDVPPIVVAVP
jgi:hypothetical protein